PGRFRAWPDRIAGHVHGVQPQILEHAVGVAELIVGLPRKADDDVGRDGYLWHRIPDAGDQIAVIARRVGAVHGPQDLVVAGLAGHVHVLAHLGEVGD